MIKDFLIPICFWIFKHKPKNKTYIIGLAGGQGTGKTTISSLIKLILSYYFKLNVFKVSIDDFYKTRKERLKLSKTKHPLLLTRGVPGTHDIDMMNKLFSNIKKTKFRTMLIPKFDKSIDDRYNKKFWFKIKKKPDILILEGWCVGAKPEKNNTLYTPINKLEKNLDSKKKWRLHVNNQLKNKYAKLFNQMHSLLYLKAKNFNVLKSWRIKQEKKLKFKNKNKKNNKIMNNLEVLNFMMTYQRITQNMFKIAPKHSSIIIDLNDRHQIKRVKFNNA
jgi:D-glycerate 3-kinase